MANHPKLSEIFPELTTSQKASSSTTTTTTTTPSNITTASNNSNSHNNTSTANNQSSSSNNNQNNGPNSIFQQEFDKNEKFKKCVLLIQRNIRRRNVKKNVKQLSNMSKKRKHVINEIIQTEKQYVQDLRTIMEIFYKPILRKGIEPKENVLNIFTNVEMIYTLNEKLLQRLQQAQQQTLQQNYNLNVTKEPQKNNKNNSKNNNSKKGIKKSNTMKFKFGKKNSVDTNTIVNSSTLQNTTTNNNNGSLNGSLNTPIVKSFGEAFLEMAPFMKLYTEYINNFQNAATILRERRKKNQNLNNYLNKCKETREECKGLDITSFMILPVQRIPRYQLLLKELLKYTPKEHSDYKKLQTTLDTMIQVANHLNEMRKQKIAFTKVLDIKNRLSELSLQLIQAMTNYLNTNLNSNQISSPTILQQNSLQQSLQNSLQNNNVWNGMMFDENDYLIMKHNFNCIEQVKNSIIKPHRHYVNEIPVKVIRDKVSSANKLQWIEKAINLQNLPEPIDFESYLFNDYFLLIIKSTNENQSTNNSPFLDENSSISSANNTPLNSTSNFSIFLKTPRDVEKFMENNGVNNGMNGGSGNLLEEMLLLTKKELTAPFIVQPFYLSMSEFQCDDENGCVLKCKDYISGSEFRIFFDNLEQRNEWYNNIIEKKNLELQKLMKQMIDKYTKSKSVNNQTSPENVTNNSTTKQELSTLQHQHSLINVNRNSLQKALDSINGENEDEKKARESSIEKFNNISFFIQTKIDLQNKFIKMVKDFDKIRQTFTKEFSKFEEIKNILQELQKKSVNSQIVNPKIELENEFLKTVTKLRNCCDRLQKGEILFKEMKEKTKECDEIILMCLRNDLESLIAFFGDSQLLDTNNLPNIENFEELQKMELIEKDSFYNEILSKNITKKITNVTNHLGNVDNSFTIPNNGNTENSQSSSFFINSSNPNLVNNNVPCIGSILVNNENNKLSFTDSMSEISEVQEVESLQFENVVTNDVTDVTNEIENIVTKSIEMSQNSDSEKMTSLQNENEKLKLEIESLQKSLQNILEEKDQITELNSNLIKKNMELTDELDCLKKEIESRDKLSINKDIVKRRSKSDAGVSKLINHQILNVTNNSSTSVTSSENSDNLKTQQLLHQKEENNLQNLVNQLKSEKESLFLEIQNLKENLQKEKEEKSNLYKEKLSIEEKLSQSLVNHQTFNHIIELDNMTYSSDIESDFDEASQHSPVTHHNYHNTNIPKLQLSNNNYTRDQFNTTLQNNVTNTTTNNNNITTPTNVTSNFASKSNPNSSTSKSRIQDKIEMYEQLVTNLNDKNNQQSSLMTDRQRKKSFKDFNEMSSNTTNFMDNNSLQQQEQTNMENKIMKITIQTIQFQLQNERLQNDLFKKNISNLNDELKIVKKKFEESQKIIEDLKRVIFNNFNLENK
ncbi:hypothetical protein ABK040_016434 [Willaertia magna]